MLVVEIQTDGSLRASPRVLFELDAGYRSGRFHSYDISPDGERFVMVRIPDHIERGHLELVFNWFEELKRLVPAE